MKLDAALPPASLSQVPAITRAAEATGFDALWTTETQHDAFLPHALIAEHSTRLRSGTGIAVSFARSPTSIAYQTRDLAEQSRGRFILGLGTQVRAHIERRFGLDWPESVTGKLREQIQVIRALWDTWQTGAPLNFRGEYYKITLMSPFFNPGPLPPEIGAPPIYIAGVGGGLAKLAGESCDGFLVHPFHTPRYLAEVLLPAIAQGREKTARADSVTISATVFAATNRKEREFCRQQVSFYASTPSYHAVMDLHGWSETAAQLSALAARGQWNEMPALISEEMLAEFVTEAASPAALAEALQKRYAALAGRLTLYLPFVPGEKDDFWRELAGAFNA